ncbi:piRNA biogenesis protein EXD1-like [Diorhabda sublineata]|uniref:piRNA biogenesis protein EXD1-like n=1 Tax=Diorhabda sublineata TaxID=1163346 RepID=UPI0024E071CC|nr:piRNA biogenesis protein EXD1-like [Diorhabda sublineata]
MEDEVSFIEKYIIGDHILISLYSDNIFEGDISDLGTNRIDLTNVKEHNNANILNGIYSFYRNEIKSIQIFKVQVNQKPDISQQIVLEKDSTKLLITKDEYDRLRTMSRNFIYIDKPDWRYFQAMELLTRAETLGVIGLGVEKRRTGSIKLLAVSVWDKIYIFDFLNKQNYFYPELKMILESEYICKVIHEAGPFLDVLYRKYNVLVRNVFDTQIVDLIIKKKETGNVPLPIRDLSDLLTDYLNFPTGYLRKALEISISEWAERPLSDIHKGYASQLVTYLLVIRENMQRTLLSEVFAAINNIHNTYYYMNSYKFSSIWNSKQISKEIQELIPDTVNFSIK